MTHILETDQVTLEFGLRRILCEVYMKCETGKVTGLLGRNGSGKSCLMQILYGERLPFEGSVRLDGKMMPGHSRNPEDMRYLPQNSFIPGALSVRQVFRDLEVDFDDFTTIFPDFRKYEKTPFKRLSGGEQRIVGIFTILVSKTKFCLLDEPFSQVMPLHVELLREIIRRESANKGILITDHLYRDVMAVCDDLYVICGAKPRQVKSLEELSAFGYTLNCQ